VPISKNVKVSIIVATYERLAQFQQCMSHVLIAMKKTPGIRYQLLVGVNGPDQEAANWLSSLRQSEVFDLIRFEKRLSPPAIRNHLVQFAKCDWVCFVDDDAYVKENYFSEFLKTLSQFPDCAVIGGPNLTPENSSWFQKMTGIVLSSRLATFFSSKRYRAKGRAALCGEESLILCNLFVKLEALGAIPFPDNVVCCEEGWMLETLKRQGFPLVYDPHLIVWHDRRASIKSFTQQVFKYGLGRGQVLRRRLKLNIFIHLIPTFCVFYSLIMLVLSFIHHRSALNLVPFLIYIPLCIVASFICVQRDDFSFRKWTVGTALFPLIHTTYGVGLAWGLIRK